MKPTPSIINFLLAFMLAGSFTMSNQANSQVNNTSSVYLPVVARNSSALNPVPRVPESVFGISTEALTSEGGLTEISASGASWARPTQPIQWSLVEPIEGQRDWTILENVEDELKSAAQLGLRTIITVDSTPAWAFPPGLDCGPVIPEKFKAFAFFMRDLVERYSNAPYQVSYWELWNEPDVAGAAGCWGDPSDLYFGGKNYGAMLATVYPQIKAADPQAQVLIGGLQLECDPGNPPFYRACDSGRFLEGILQASGGDYFDGISFHASDGFAIFDFPWGTAYQYSNYAWHSSWSSNGPVVVEKANFIRSVLNEYDQVDKMLYNTQSALLCGSCFEVPVFETAKAGYVVQVYTSAASIGLLSNIWESLFGWQNSGLLYPDFSPRPAYQAFQFARQQIGGAVWLGEIQSEDVGGLDGIRGHKFERAGTQVWVMWYVSSSEESNTAYMSLLPDSAWDMYGNALIPSIEMAVGQYPIYIEWNQ